MNEQQHPKFALARQQAIFDRLFKTIEDFETDVRRDPLKHISRANRMIGALRDAMNRAMYELNGGALLRGALPERPQLIDFRTEILERNRRAYEILKEALNERI